MNQSSSVTEIDLRANVCSVKYSPVNEHELAVGSADHNVLLFDTRRHATPLHVFSGKILSSLHAKGGQSRLLLQLLCVQFVDSCI